MHADHCRQFVYGAILARTLTASPRLSVRRVSAMSSTHSFMGRRRLTSRWVMTSVFIAPISGSRLAGARWRAHEWRQSPVCRIVGEGERLLEADGVGGSAGRAWKHRALDLIESLLVEEHRHR